jgi:hypothetical protein
LLKFEDILFWTCYKELGTDIYLDEDIFKAICMSNRDLSCSVIRTWKYYLRMGTLEWDADRTARIKRFVEAAHRLLGDCEDFESTTYFESWLNRNADSE